MTLFLTLEILRNLALPKPLKYLMLLLLWERIILSFYVAKDCKYEYNNFLFTTDASYDPIWTSRIHLSETCTILTFCYLFNFTSTTKRKRNYFCKKGKCYIDDFRITIIRLMLFTLCRPTWNVERNYMKVDEIIFHWFFSPPHFKIIIAEYSRKVSITFEIILFVFQDFASISIKAFVILYCKT